MGLLAVKFINWGSISGDYGTCLFWGQWGEDGGTRLQARSFPQTELWVCQKQGVESKGQKALLQIIYIGDIFKC